MSIGSWLKKELEEVKREIDSSVEDELEKMQQEKAARAEAFRAGRLAGLSEAAGIARVYGWLNGAVGRNFSEREEGGFDRADEIAAAIEANAAKLANEGDGK